MVKLVFLKLRMAYQNSRNWLIVFFSRLFWKDKIILGGLALALFLNLVLALLIYFKIPDSNLPLILHYSVYQGVDILGGGSRIYLLPAISLIFFILNLILADFFYKKEKLISYFFIIALPLVAIFFLIAGINLMIINN